MVLEPWLKERETPSSIYDRAGGIKDKTDEGLGCIRRCDFILIKVKPLEDFFGGEWQGLIHT